MPTVIMSTAIKCSLPPSRPGADADVHRNHRRRRPPGRSRNARRRRAPDHRRRQPAVRAMSQLGESIAVNGVCLTVVAFDASSLRGRCLQRNACADHARRSARRRALNLERAMRADRSSRRASGQRPCRRRRARSRHHAGRARAALALRRAGGAAALHRHEGFDLRRRRQPDRQRGRRARVRSRADPAHRSHTRRSRRPQSAMR